MALASQWSRSLAFPHGFELFETSYVPWQAWQHTQVVVAFVGFRMEFWSMEFEPQLSQLTTLGAQIFIDPRMLVAHFDEYSLTPSGRLSHNCPQFQFETILVAI